MRKRLSLALAALLLVGLLPTMALAADTYIDVPASHWAHTAVAEWSTEEKGILLGYGNGKFGPSDPITQGDLNRILSRLLGTAELGGPATPLTREDAFAAFAKAFGYAPVSGATSFADDGQIGAAAKPYINALQRAGVILGKGGGLLDPKGVLTRAEILQVIYNAVSRVGGIGDGTAAPAVSYVGQSEVAGTNFVLLSVTGGGATYAVNGAAVKASNVLANGSLVKIELPPGAKTATVTAARNGVELLRKEVAFAAAGAAAPKRVFGTVPMSFSAFFHDITGSITTVTPTVTAFATGGTVAAPALFITQGNRAGDLTYAQGDALPKVDAVSSATYGDDVHYVPNGNLTLTGADRKQHSPDNSIAGITKAEVGVVFDLYANAKLLADANRGTAQSAHVLAQYAALTVVAKQLANGSYVDQSGAATAAPAVYKPKYLLADGNWGKRATAAVNQNAVKALPGDGMEMEPVTYGGTWADKMTGVSFGTLQDEYGGTDAALYFDNYAEYIYGGYIEDSAGHREPLVFLQNLFTHRMHTDFDIAVSPSRFARFKNLTPSGAYTVHVYAWGFEDVDTTFTVKDYINGGAALSAATVTALEGGPAQTLTISGLDSFASYQTAGFALLKGSLPVDAGQYAVAAEGGVLKLTLKTALFTGAFQGAYTVRLTADADTVASKTLALSLVKRIARPKLTADPAGDGSDATADSPLSVTASGQLYFTNAEFARALVTSGRSVANVAEQGTTAATAGAFVKETADGVYKDAYYIDLSKLTAGKTYVVTALATGFETQTYTIKVG